MFRPTITSSDLFPKEKKNIGRNKYRKLSSVLEKEDKVSTRLTSGTIHFH